MKVEIENLEKIIDDICSLTEHRNTEGIGELIDDVDTLVESAQEVYNKFKDTIEAVRQLDEKRLINSLTDKIDACITENDWYYSDGDKIKHQSAYVDYFYNNAISGTNILNSIFTMTANNKHESFSTVLREMITNIYTETFNEFQLYVPKIYVSRGDELHKTILNLHDKSKMNALIDIIDKNRKEAERIKLKKELEKAQWELDRNKPKQDFTVHLGN